MRFRFRNGKPLWKKTMSCIIECNGLPGCGKTVLAGRIAAHLRADGEKIRIRGVREFRGGGMHGFRKALLLLHRMSALLQRGGLSAAAGSLFCQRKGSHTAAFLNGKERLITVMYLFYLLREYRKAGPAIVVSDEGLVQTLCVISSWADVRGPAFSGACRMLSEGGVFCVDCDLPAAEAQRRIERRARKDSAVDALQGEELTAYLEAYAETLRSIRTLAAFRTAADMKDSPDRIAADAAEAFRRE